MLAINLKPQGGDRSTALTYNNLASNLDTQGRLTEAVASWTAAAALYDRTRGAQGASGLERSLTATSSPLSALAIALARQGKPRDAWGRWETDLARGLLDDLSARKLRPLTADQLRREADLAGQLQRLDEQITRLAAKAKHTQEEDKQFEAMRNQQSDLRGQWVEFRNALDQQYQAYAGKPSTLEEIQKALRTDAALVGWLDVNQHHWACVVRREGDPAWVKIAGTGKDGAWTVEDDDRPGKLRERCLAGHQARLERAGGGPGPASGSRSPLDATPEGCEASDRSSLAGVGGSADRNAGRFHSTRRRAKAHRQLCPFGLDVRPPDRAALPAVRSAPAAGPGRSRLPQAGPEWPASRPARPRHRHPGRRAQRHR